VRSLEEAPGLAEQMLEGQVRGRVVFSVDR
jgi:hypothetical protein